MESLEMLRAWQESGYGQRWEIKQDVTVTREDGSIPMLAGKWRSKLYYTYANQAIWNPNQGGESTRFYVGGWWGPVQRQGVRGKEVDGGQQRGLMWCQAVGLQLPLLSGEGNKSRNGRNSTFVIVLLMACWIWGNCTGNPIPLTRKLTDLIDCFKKYLFFLTGQGCFTYMHVCAPWACSTQGGQMRVGALGGRHVGALQEQQVLLTPRLPLWPYFLVSYKTVARYKWSL